MLGMLQVIHEPDIEFRYGQRLVDPHDGLSLFGPCDVDASSHPKSIRYGIVGTEKGIDTFLHWARYLNCPLITPERDARLWPPYPGFEVAFASEWPPSPVWTYSVGESDLLAASKDLDKNKRAFRVVDLFLAGIKIASKKDEQIDVFVCVVPEEVWENCRPESELKEGIGRKITKDERTKRSAGQMDMFESFDPEQYQMSVDFRRQIKARAMKYGIPIQIVRESTLVSDDSKSDRGLTPLSDRAWNLSTALYYKAGGKPWRLAAAREGVCYLGIAFRKTSDDPRGRSACCAAQMFLDSGDGIVFLGEYGPWYSPEKKQFHLDRKSARKLLKGVLETYRELEGKPLKEIFIHSRSGVDTDEFQGYKEASGQGASVIGVRVRPDFDVKIFREGSRVVLRGSFWQLDQRRGYLWAAGFKPHLGTYDGWEIPNPLRVEVQQGDADISLVVKDILALTKLNYNACKLGDSEPVTVRFSDAVGEILVSNPGVTDRSPNFKFYI